MSIAWISIYALLFIIFLSRWDKLPVGLIAIAIAFSIGWYEKFPAFQIIRFFPVSLFILLLSITFFFSLAQVNGTLYKLTHIMVHFAKGKVAAIPIIFFILGLILAAIGPGNIGAIAMLAPIAMTVAGKTGISAFFMTIMLVSGSNAGAFSPFAPTGIIADGLIAQLHLDMDPWLQIFLPSLLMQSLFAFGCYIFFITHLRKKQKNLIFNVDEIMKSDDRFNHPQRMTILAIGLLITGVALFKIDIEILAMGLTLFLIFIRASDLKAAIKSVPWKIIILVSGTSMLINLMGKTGGLEIFTTLIAKISTPMNVTGILALITGIMSSYSSSSGVIMPTFIPLVPGLIEKIGGGNAMTMIASINVGSHIVDISPLSTLGALCIANAAKHENKHQLFRRLLIFGLSMSLVGAVVCFIFLGWMGHWFIK